MPSVKKLEVISNTVLMPAVVTTGMPSLGWEFHSDGTNHWKFVFATGKGGITTTFPPAASGLGNSPYTYWYMKTGENGPDPKKVWCSYLDLGDDLTEALFDSTDIVGTVNGSTTGAVSPVSTAGGDVVIKPESLADRQFVEWIPLWGHVQVSGDTLTGTGDKSGHAVAVYQKKPIATLDPVYIEIQDALQHILDPIDLVADFLDEGFLRIIDQVAFDSDRRAHKQILEVLDRMEVGDYRTLRVRQLELQSEMRRLQLLTDLVQNVLQHGTKRILDKK